MKGFKLNFENFLKDKSKNKEFRDKNYYLNQETQQDILNIQEAKIKLIDHMHDLLRKIDNNENVSFSPYGKKIIMEDDQAKIIKRGGETESVSRGDIMVAGINGFDLDLHADIDRETRKEFVVRETKRRIAKLYDEQLLMAELENINKRSDDLGILSYENIADRQDLGVYESKKTGLLAETMVESYLTKIFIDNSDLPFSIEPADIYDDVRNKMDFKLRIKRDYNRGVNVRTHKNTGIQFTMDAEKTKFKKEQIRKSKAYMDRLDEKPVDDLILVSFPITEIKESIDKWKSDGKHKSIAGPSEKWSKETKKLVFIKMIEKLPESLNINPEELWDSIQK